MWKLRNQLVSITEVKLNTLALPIRCVLPGVKGAELWKVGVSKVDGGFFSSAVTKNKTLVVKT